MKIFVAGFFFFACFFACVDNSYAHHEEVIAALPAIIPSLYWLGTLVFGSALTKIFGTAKSD
ncbi:MAG: hypothetical protein ACO3L1_00255 [Flavobacteriaceae bacterium]